MDKPVLTKEERIADKAKSAEQSKKAITKNVVITPQQFDMVEAIRVRRECSFSEALRRVLDSWIDAKAEGIVNV